MKPLTIILGTAITGIALMAFSFNHLKKSSTSESFCKAPSTEIDAKEKGYSNFFYDLRTRFKPIQKSKIQSAQNIFDIAYEGRSKEVFEYQSVSIIQIENGKRTEIKSTGKDEKLTPSQIKLLRNADYSSNFVIQADYIMRNHETGKLEFNYFSPHFTVVPEKQAYHSLGKKAILQHFKKGNYENTYRLDESKLQPAKLYFTVSTEGKLKDLYLDRTSGYSNIDSTMKKLLESIPGEWIPAENLEGEKVDQQLVISFGMEGC